jgi:tetratricopeptide (TPR) repeat protein
MDTPSARERGDFNWGSTAWHELTHAFTLGASDHRVPRWLSEGMSVLEERRAGRGWGADASLSFIAALGGGRLRPMSQLNDGFLRPRFPEETAFSYYQASLFTEMVEAQKGAAALPAMLVAYRNGLDTPGVFKRVLGMTPEQVDAAFELWMRGRFAKPLQAVAARDSAGASGAFVNAMREGIAQLERSQRDSARATFERARTMIPDYSGSDGPAWYLARLERDAGNVAAALTNVSQVTMRNETAWDANMLEAELREKNGDEAGAIAALERLIWIHPYDPALHTRIATLAARRNAHARVIRERRAILAVNPPDVLDARFELARALAASGDNAGARRELLAVLEQAPSFEKAQALLLELRGRQ